MTRNATQIHFQLSCIWGLEDIKIQIDQQKERKAQKNSKRKISQSVR